APGLQVNALLKGYGNLEAGPDAPPTPVSMMRPQASDVPTAARPSSDGMVTAHCTQELACAIRRRIPGSRGPHSPAMIEECTSECLSMVGSVVVRPRIVNRAVSRTA